MIPFFDDVENNLHYCSKYYSNHLTAMFQSQAYVIYDSAIMPKIRRQGNIQLATRIVRYLTRQYKKIFR